MAVQKQKLFTFLQEKSGKKGKVYELYPASEWPGQVARPEGLFRVRVRDYNKRKSGRWLSPAGKYTFFPLQAVLALMGEDAAAALGTGPIREQARPEIAKGDPLRFWSVAFPILADSGKLPKDAPRCKGVIYWAKGPAILKPDGRWYVEVYDYDKGKIKIPVDQTERI